MTDASFRTQLIAGAAVLCAVFAVLSARPASAMTEICPADAVDISPIGVAMGTAAPSYSYELVALTPRSVNAAMIADTNEGWFAWSVDAVLAKIVPARFSPAYGYGAQSIPLAVAFPKPLILRHAWIVRAKSNGGVGSDCDVPAFPEASITTPVVAFGKPVPTPSPLPSPEAAPVAASAASAPFIAQTCASPFQPARLVEGVSPEYPESAKDLGLGPVTIDAEVVVDGKGTLLDTWIYRTSGNASIDAATLRAIRLSSYAGARSYCLPVRSVYLFRADFNPR